MVAKKRPTTAQQPEKPAPTPRRIRDAQTLRALTHPVRIALIETLSLHGAMTATEAGERIGESPTTCSFHLRQLAKYGFVEEAGGGKGRARPWRMTSIGISIGANPGDTETELAAGALGQLMRERQLARYRTWLQTRASYPRQWRDAAMDSEYVVFVTVEELQALEKDLNALLIEKYWDRITDASIRPPDAVPVEILLFGYPMTPPAGTASSADQPTDAETAAPGDKPAHG